MKPVLVVEDDADIRTAVCEWLSEAGFKVAGAEDGADALRVLETIEGPCAIFLDLLMPNMDGLTFLEHLRERRPDLVGLTVVTSASPGLRREVTQRGLQVAAALSKPYELSVLTEVVRRLC